MAHGQDLTPIPSLTRRRGRHETCSVGGYEFENFLKARTSPLAPLLVGEGNWVWQWLVDG